MMSHVLGEHIFDLFAMMLAPTKEPADVYKHSRETALGPFELLDSIFLEDVQSHLKEKRLKDILMSPAQALAHLPAIYVHPRAEVRVLNGAMIRIEDVREVVDYPVDTRVRMLNEPGELLAVGKMVHENIRKHNQGFVAPEKVFAT